MRNPETQWLWKKVFKSATGSACSGVTAGTMMGLIDPIGATTYTVAVIGGAAGFVGSIVGDFVGYLLDDVSDNTFASYALYNFVVGLLFLIPLSFLIVFVDLKIDRQIAIGAASFSIGLLTSSSARLIDDIRARINSNT